MSNRTITLIQEAAERLRERMQNDPEYAKEFLRSVMGPPTRRLEGKEHEQMMLLFSMTEPVRETNNQHSWCAEYNIGGKMYNVHYFPDEEPFIDLILEEE